MASNFADLEEHSPGDFEAIWCAGNTAVGTIGDRPVYSDGDSFRVVSWPEAFKLLANLMEKDEQGELRPREFAIFLRLAGLNWGGRETSSN
jgi:hypothetical protein